MASELHGGGPREGDPAGSPEAPGADRAEDRVWQGAGARRVHPATVAFDLLALARGMLGPAVLLLLFVGRGVLPAVAIVGALMALRLGLAWFFFTFGVEGDELVARGGIIARHERHVPLARIQDVKLEQTLVQRAVGLVSVEVESAGGSEPEIVLRMLGRQDGEALRDALLANRAARARARGEGGAAGAGALGEPVEAPPEVDLFRLTSGELVLAGLTSSRVGLLAAGLFAFGYEATDWVPLLGRPVASFLRALPQALATQPFVGLALVFGAALAATLVALVLAGTFSAIALHGFTLSQRAGELRRRHGLLTVRASSLPRRRVQAVMVDEGGLRWLVGLAGLHAVSAGSAVGSHQEARQGRDAVVPIARAEVAWGLVGLLLPRLGGLAEGAPEAPWRGISRRALGRSLVLAGLGVGAVAAGLGVAFGVGAAWATLTLLPVALGVAALRFRRFRYARLPGHVLVRHGIVGVRTTVVPLDKLQGVLVHRTPDDRILGLARVLFDTAGQPLFDRPAIPGLLLADAEAMARSIAHEAARLPFRW